MADELKRPKVGVGVILMGEGENILLGKRKNSHGAGTWSFPGGHLEFMETLRQCAEREMLEETGLVKGVNYLFVDSEACTSTNNFFEKENRHDITLYLRAEYITGEPRVMEPNKCEEWRWYDWSKLDSLNLFVPVRNLKMQRYSPYA
jgi:8-oxo-dGTP diphosphatase